MKKVISMLAVAALLCVGLAFTSCSACPGGSKAAPFNAKKGACVSGSGGADCDDTCIVTQYASDPKKDSYSCDC